MIGSHFKFLLYCSLAALVGVIAARMLVSQTVSIPAQHYVADGEKVLLIKGRTAGQVKPWMAIEAFNGYMWHNEGFNPSYTRVVVDYKPMFRKLKNGQWEIQFTSEIAEGIP